MRRKQTPRPQYTAGDRQLHDRHWRRTNVQENDSHRVLAWNLDEHRKAAVALDEGGDVRIIRVPSCVNRAFLRREVATTFLRLRPDLLFLLIPQTLHLLGLPATQSAKTIGQSHRFESNPSAWGSTCRV